MSVLVVGRVSVPASSVRSVIEAGGSGVRAVEAYLGTLEATGTVSRSVRRQRSWALRELLLFCAAHELGGSVTEPGERALAVARVPRITVQQMFRAEIVEAWLRHADAVLRGVTTSSPATRRARVTSLRGLAGYLGSDVPPHRDPKPALRGLLTEPEIASALRVLTGPLPGRGSDDHVRLAAILSVMSVWPVRSVQLSGLLVSQVQRRGSALLLDVGEANSAEPGVAGADVAGPVLIGVAAERLLAWLELREVAAAALHGGAVRQLWTSIRSNSRPAGPGAAGRRGSLPLPAGMPLRPRGLQRAYARSVVAANLAHAGRPGFPLPPSLDLLRRSLDQQCPPVPPRSPSGAPRPSDQ